MSVGPVPDISGGLMMTATDGDTCRADGSGGGDGHEWATLYPMAGQPPSPCGGSGGGSSCGCHGSRGGGSAGGDQLHVYSDLWGGGAAGSGGWPIRWPLANQCPPPPGLNPVPVPSGPYTLGVIVMCGGSTGGETQGLLVFCDETGEVQVSTATMHFSTAGVYTFRTPGGAGVTIEGVHVVVQSGSVSWGTSYGAAYIVVQPV